MFKPQPRQWATGYVKDLRKRNGGSIWVQYDDQKTFPNEWLKLQGGPRIVLLKGTGGIRHQLPKHFASNEEPSMQYVGIDPSEEHSLRIPERIPRVLEKDEPEMSEDLQTLLRSCREQGAIMQIPPEQIWIHESLHKPYYNSFDVGKVVGSIIPAAMSDGFPRIGIRYEPEFTSPRLPPHTQVPLARPGFEGWKEFVEDCQKTSMDPTLLTNIQFGFPQSCCCPFEKMILKNPKMADINKDEIRNSNQKEIDLGRCSKRMSAQDMDKMMPIFVSMPNNVIPKNSAEKTKMNQNPLLTLADVETRIIYNVSKKDKAGGSINSRTSYETLHSCRFITTGHVEAAVLEAKDRLTELGLPHEGRINLWKCDIKSAYRNMMSCCADYFLGCHGIDDTFIIEYAQQFGQKSSVTIFHRFVYALTSLMSAPEWANELFPEMCLELDPERDGPRTQRPSIESIQTELKRFRDGDINGCIDPAVFLWVAWYLDDFIGITIDVRDDISTPFKPDEDGIRSPIGKALNYFLKRYKIPQNLKKRIEENDVLLMGNQTPVVLGILFNLNELRLYVRPEYAEDLAERMESWIQKGVSHRHCSEEWGFIQGRLGFATVVYPLFKAFMREIWLMYARILSNNHNAYCPSNDVLDNMKIMAKVLRNNYGRSMFHNKAWRHTFQRGLQHCFKDPSANDVTHDASTGFGFGFSNFQQEIHYFRAWRGKEILIAKEKKIYELEAIAMFITFHLNKEFLHDTRLNMLGDNMGLVQSFRYCGSSTPIVNAIVRELILLLSNAGIELNCDREKFDVNWIDTVEMKGADALSRNAEGEFFQYLKENFHGKKSVKLEQTDPRVVQAEAALTILLNKYY